MATDMSLQMAARVWCKPETEHKVMDTVLAEAFAEVLDEVKAEARLGYATTRELLAELTARIEVDGNLDYSTMG